MGVDKYRYDEAWELALPSFVDKLYPTALDILTELKVSVKVTVTELKKGKPAAKTNGVKPVLPPQLEENTTLLDFRTASAFNARHLPGAVNFPLSTLTDDTPSPFEDSKILERQWLELDKLFSKKETAANGQPPAPTTPSNKSRRTSWVNWVPGFGASNPSGDSEVGQEQRETIVDEVFIKNKNARVVFVYYGGDTARVATSILRAKGIEAWSLRGGMKKWDEESDKATAKSTV